MVARGWGRGRRDGKHPSFLLPASLSGSVPEVKCLEGRQVWSEPIHAWPGAPSPHPTQRPLGLPARLPGPSPSGLVPSTAAPCVPSVGDSRPRQVCGLMVSFRTRTVVADSQIQKHVKTPRIPRVNLLSLIVEDKASTPGTQGFGTTPGGNIWGAGGRALAGPLRPSRGDIMAKGDAWPQASPPPPPLFAPVASRPPPPSSSLWVFCLPQGLSKGGGPPPRRTGCSPSRLGFPGRLECAGLCRWRRWPHATGTDAQPQGSPGAGGTGI